MRFSTVGESHGIFQSYRNARLSSPTQRLQKSRLKRRPRNLAHLYSKKSQSEESFEAELEECDLGCDDEEEESRGAGKSDFYVTSLVEDGKSTLQIVETF